MHHVVVVVSVLDDLELSRYTSQRYYELDDSVDKNRHILWHPHLSTTEPPQIPDDVSACEFWTLLHFLHLLRLLLRLLLLLLLQHLDSCPVDIKHDRENKSICRGR